MSSAPHPYPTYAPDPPSRFRWVPPLCLGIAVGGLIGCVATFAILELGKRSRTNELVAEQYSIQQVLAGTPGAGDLRVTEDTTVHLGQMGGRTDSGSAVRRRIVLQGPIVMQGSVRPADLNGFVQGLKTQVETEIGRQGAFMSGGGSSSSSGGGDHTLNEESGYHTRDGRRGQLDLHLVIRNGRAHGILILTEGR